MKCPRCIEYELKTVQADGVEVDQCENCLGIWCDVSEMKELVSARGLGAIRLTGKPGGMRTVLPLTCPRDGAALDMVNDVRAADVQIDVCPKCGGRWLDGGELDRLRQKGFLADVKNFFVTYILPG
jgi:Zn-finger nucleic acid-binding protein